MDLFLVLAVGLGVGVGASFWLTRHIDLLVINIIISLAGSIMGLVFAYVFFSPATDSDNFINIPAILLAAIFAMIGVGIFNLVHERVDNTEATRPKPPEVTDKEEHKTF